MIVVCSQHREVEMQRRTNKCMDEGFLDQIGASSLYQLAIFTIRMKNR